MDITERKQAEQALREADRKKDDFIATLAHELRNPLAPMRNAVNVLRSIDSGDAQIAWCRDVIERQVDQMARLLDDLLDVSRLTRGSFHLRREPLDLARGRRPRRSRWPGRTSITARQALSRATGRRCRWPCRAT